MFARRLRSGSMVDSSRDDSMLKDQSVPKYFPIAVSPAIKASHSDLIRFEWNECAITADFVMPGDEHSLLRVEFDRAEIVRLVDEMAISTEHEETSDEGIVPDHFAYSVQGTGADAWTD